MKGSALTSNTRENKGVNFRALPKPIARARTFLRAIVYWNAVDDDDEDDDEDDVRYDQRCFVKSAVKLPAFPLISSLS
jgi:hypothetical protein